MNRKKDIDRGGDSGSMRDEEVESGSSFPFFPCGIDEA